MAIISVGTATENSGTDLASGDWTLPDGWAAGDLLIAFWYCRNGNITVTPPGTVTQKINSNGGGTDFGTLFVGYRYLQVGDSTFTWTSNSISADGDSMLWGGVVLRGGPTAGDPFEATGGPTSNSNQPNPEPPNVTTLSANAWVITVVGMDDDPSGTDEIVQPSGYTKMFYVEDVAGLDASMAVARFEKASPGLEDPASWTSTAPAGTDSMTWTGAVAPLVLLDVGRRYKRLVGPQQIPTSEATLYTVPTGMRARVRNIHLSNPGVSEIDVSLEIGGVLSFERPVAADDVYAARRPIAVTLEAGEVISGYASDTGVVAVIDGVEEAV